MDLVRWVKPRHAVSKRVIVHLVEIPQISGDQSGGQPRVAR